MATGIEWTDETWNPVRGCSRVSEGCRHCYAERVASRFSGDGRPFAGYVLDGKWTGRIALVREKLDQPLRWKRARRIFVNSMSDLFHEDLDDGGLDNIFATMALAPQHIFQILTKRPVRMRDYIHAVASDHRAERVWQLAWERQPGCDGWDTRPWPLPNVWLGVSVENQATADERIPLLLQTPAALRFLSCEPLLGPVDLRYLQPGGPPVEIDALRGTHGVLRPHGGENARLDWIIVGGESGPGARPMHPAWARELRDQCTDAGVPFFFKQWGAWAPSTGDVEGVCYLSSLDGEAISAIELDARMPNDRIAWQVMTCAGKKAAGRLLDGVEWSQFPEGVR